MGNNTNSNGTTTSSESYLVLPEASFVEPRGKYSTSIITNGILLDGKTTSFISNINMVIEMMKIQMLHSCDTAVPPLLISVLVLVLPS